MSLRKKTKNSISTYYSRAWKNYKKNKAIKLAKEKEENKKNT